MIPEFPLPEGPIGDAIGLYLQAFQIMFIVCFIPTAIAWWRTHEKGDRPGWTGVVPFYNLLVLARIVGAPWWQGVLMMFVGTAIPGSLLLMPRMARAFGLNPWLGVVSAFFPPLIFWVVGFGKVEYYGPQAQMFGEPPG